MTPSQWAGRRATWSAKSNTGRRGINATTRAENNTFGFDFGTTLELRQHALAPPIRGAASGYGTYLWKSSSIDLAFKQRQNNSHDSFPPVFLEWLTMPSKLIWALPEVGSQLWVDQVKVHSMKSYITNLSCKAAKIWNPKMTLGAGREWLHTLIDLLWCMSDIICRVSTADLEGIWSEVEPHARLLAPYWCEEDLVLLFSALHAMTLSVFACDRNRHKDFLTFWFLRPVPMDSEGIRNFQIQGSLASKVMIVRKYHTNMSHL